jgi:hypothetical protein
VALLWLFDDAGSTCLDHGVAGAKIPGDNDNDGFKSLDQLTTMLASIWPCWFWIDGSNQAMLAVLTPTSTAGTDATAHL